MPSSGLKASDNLDFPKVGPAAKHLIEHSFNQGSSLGYSSKEEDNMAPMVLEKKKAIGDELAK